MRVGELSPFYLSVTSGVGEEEMPAPLCTSALTVVRRVGPKIKRAGELTLPLENCRTLDTSPTPLLDRIKELTLLKSCRGSDPQMCIRKIHWKNSRIFNRHCKSTAWLHVEE